MALDLLFQVSVTRILDTHCLELLILSLFYEDTRYSLFVVAHTPSCGSGLVVPGLC